MTSERTSVVSRRQSGAPRASAFAALLRLFGLFTLARRVDRQTANMTQTDEQQAAVQSRSFVLQVVQPGLAGLMDGSVSTLAPIFATAFVTGVPFKAFLVGMAAATGAGISMAFSEALSDNGEITGRGNPWVRGGITGLMTFLGGSFHTLPFLIANVRTALAAAYVVVAVELVIIAAIRHRFFGTSWALSILQVMGGGALVFIAALIFGHA